MVTSRPLREGRDGKCEGRNEKCEFLARESVSSSPIFEFLARESVNSSPILARQWWRHFRLSLYLSLSLSLSLLPKVPHAQYRKRFRASYNTERERDRRKWRHHCRAKIGDEFTLSLAKNSHLAMSLHFPLPKTRTFRFSFHTSHLTLLKWSPLWGAEIRNEFSLSVAKKFRPLCSDTLKWRDCSFHRKNESNTYQKLLEIEKRDCAWGCARGINTTRENLQIAKHKSGRRSFRSPDWFVLCDLQIFSGGVYPPSATSRTISFSISNSFWY